MARSHSHAQSQFAIGFGNKYRCDRLILIDNKFTTFIQKCQLSIYRFFADCWPIQLYFMRPQSLLLRVSVNIPIFKEAFLNKAIAFIKKMGKLLT